MPVSQVITAIPAAGHRGVDTQDIFVDKQEAFQDALTNIAVSQLNTAFGQLNTLETNVNNQEASAEAHAGTATTQAGIATTKAGEASTSATNALASENAAELAEGNTVTLMNQFENNVYVRSATPPASIEAVWFDTTVNTVKIWNGSSWVTAGTSIQGMYYRSTYTATANQTVFNSTYDIGSVIVYRNGLMLLEADYTASNGTSITLAIGANAGDVIDIVGMGAINSSMYYNKTETDGLITASAFTLAQAQATALCF